MTDEDPPDDWPYLPTRVDDPPTAPHRTIDWLGGREAGFSVGVELVIASYAKELRAAGFSDQEIVIRARRIRAAVDRA